MPAVTGLRVLHKDSVSSFFVYYLAIFSYGRVTVLFCNCNSHAVHIVFAEGLFGIAFGVN